MTNSGIDQMVSQLRAVAAQAGQSSAVNGPAPAQDFSELLKSAIAEVDATQQEARQLTRQFETGDPNVDLQDVVLSLQKASVSFQTMVQVRNKLVSAYQEIMNMQV
jgi:flagellar hook-basal body complex protein FliE